MSGINEREYNEHLCRAIKLTGNEVAMLAAILDNEFHDAWLDPFGPVWNWTPCTSFGPSAGGIMASLSKKGLVIHSDEREAPDDRTVALTISGFTTLYAYEPSCLEGSNPYLSA